MAENLYLRITGPAGEYKLEWLLLDESTGIVRVRGSGDEATFSELMSSISWSGEVHLLLPGEEVLLTTANIPSKQQRQILQAVPFMVEEQLAMDVEDCHFAVARLRDGDVSVAVVTRAYLESCLSFLKEHNLTCYACIPDTLLVPWESGCHILVEGSHALIRTGPNLGFAIETELLANSIGLLDEATRAQVSLAVHEDERESIALVIDQLNAELENPIAVQLLDCPAFEALCRNVTGNELNLLQGDFKHTKPRQKSSSGWRSVAILAACAMGLHLTVTLGQAVYYDLNAVRMESEARQLYGEVFPGDRNVRDLRRRWQSHLGGGSQTGQFLALFVETAKHLPGSNLVLNNVSFNEGRGDLLMQLESAQNDQLIAFTQTLSRLGMEAEIVTISQSEEGVRGSVKVKMLGGS